MRIFISAILLLSAASPIWADGAQEEKEPSKVFRALGWATYGVSTTDAISTEIALSRGAHERNPLQRNRAVRLSYHVALPILVNKGTEALRKRGHEKCALWLRIAAVATYGYLTAHNLRQGRE